MYQLLMADLAIRDTGTYTSSPQKFGAEGFGNGIVQAENTLDKTVNISIEGAAHDGALWSVIGTGSATVGTGTFIQALTVPYGDVRAKFSCPTAPTEGTIKVFVNRAP